MFERLKLGGIREFTGKLITRGEFFKWEW